VTRWCPVVVVAAFAGIVPATPRSVFAQAPRVAVEGALGHAGFLDDATIDHSVWGAAGRWYLLPRVAIGPELVYFKGPRQDRDLAITGNVTFDFFAGSRITPFLVAGGGLFRHSDRFGARTFTSTEGSFTAGGGVRVPIGERLYIAPEFRVGWEPHYRVSVAAGWRFGN
jgi:hypothetical protein